MNRASFVLAVLLVACSPARQPPVSADPEPVAPTASTRAETTGFALAVPEGWTNSPVDNGLALTSADGRMQIVVTGGYPTADLPRLKQLVADGMPMQPLHPWEMRTIEGRRWETAAWSDARAQLDVYFATLEDVTVLVTVEYALPLAPVNDRAADAILASLAVRGLVVTPPTQAAPAE